MTREEHRVKGSAHPRFLLEALAIKLARLADLRPIEELIAAIDRAPSGRPPEESGGPGAGSARPRAALAASGEKLSPVAGASPAPRPATPALPPAPARD